MNRKIIRYFSPSNTFPFITENNRLYPNLEGIEDPTVDKWLEIYKIEAPGSIEMRYDPVRGIEFYGETITLSGVFMDQETGKLSIDLQSLETVIAQIPFRVIDFENTAQTEKSKATDES